MANAALNVHSLAELAALSKAKPGTLSYTAASIPLIAFMDKWTKATGADIVKVPFRGGAEAVNNLMGGSTPIAFFGLANWLSFIRDGTVTALAVDSKQRSPLLPDVPTLTELGYGDNLTRLYFGIVAPAGTPQPIIHKLRDEFAVDRRRSGIPAEADDRRRARTGVRHAGGIRALSRAGSRRFGPPRPRSRHGAAVIRAATPGEIPSWSKHDH